MEGKVNLLDCTIEEIQKLLLDICGEKYRAKQIFQWINKGVNSIDDMTNISKDLREKLKNISFISNMRIVKRADSGIDETKKYVFELNDGNIIESVLMSYKHGLTVCVSSQIGCRMGCTFCASTGIGFVRNLSSGEMLAQVLSIQSDVGRKIGNIVLMGIGEPLDNYKNVLKFIKTVNLPDGLNISYRRITVSTCGVVPGITALSNEGIPVNLSISLHASNDELRRKIMPINRKYSIDKTVEACKIYTEATNRRMTFEYVMIDGMNDKREQAFELAKRIKGMLCHINLIPVNEVDHADYRRSSKKQMEEFKHILERHGIETTIRRELGEDINAACGQLRRSIVSGESG